jgi:deoxycytidylate deaminase
VNHPYEVHTDQSTEIVIGIIGPLGTDNSKVQRLITERLKDYGYHSEIIRIAKIIIPALAGLNRMPKGNPFRHAMTQIDLGNEIRRESKNRAVLAIAAAAEIRRRRPEPEEKVQKVAYIISSLKNPDEVAELRKIYGNGFYLFAVHTDKNKRLQNLETRGMKSSQAMQLITRDEDEVEAYGQHTRDAFHLADHFVADENNEDKLRSSIWRCLDLIFGSPTITPTFNEFAMFMAFAAALRSADLSRQVGAVVARRNEILSTGANDCPCPGGGLYWPIFIGDRVDDVPQGRDFKRGYDSNSIEKAKLVKDIVEKFPPKQRSFAEKILKRSGLMDLTEYGRVVHAEMEALLACARSNVSCMGATLYCSTFPCHNCAKHIIAAGIEQVIYVEPYPKSKALEFHDDAITIEKIEGGEKRVRFKPFIGVGPRQFFDLFSLSLSAGRQIERKTDSGAASTWSANGAMPRVQMLPVQHRDFESNAFDYIKKLKHN